MILNSASSPSSNRSLDVLAIRVVDFRNMAQAFDTFVQFDKHSKRRVSNNPAANRIARHRGS